MERRPVRSSFNNLSEEIQDEIFKKLNSWKTISKAMCVSPTWRNTILDNNLPKGKNRDLVKVLLSRERLFILDNLFHWCSQVMRCYVTHRKIIGTSNGLMLFCHEGGRAQNVIYGVYHYYVVNHFTKQCLAIVKPVGTMGYSYAALAYDPYESWFFKIMRFQGCRHINIFSSENGRWITLTIDLPEEVNKACWLKKCVYAKGVIYRLSQSGHIIMFRVDPQETIGKQALAFTLPPACLLTRCQWDIGVKDNSILFTMSLGRYIFVFELMECVQGDVITHSWRKIRCSNNRNLQNLRLLSYHPYHRLAFFKRKFSQVLVIFNERNNTRSPLKKEHNAMLYTYMRDCSLPLLQCSITFSCRLDTEEPRSFWWLPSPR